MGTNYSNIYEENYFITEDTIINRYQAEKKISLFVTEGNYEGVRQVLDSMPRNKESYLDFEARSPYDTEQRLRDIALIANSGLRSILLNTQIPVTLLHGLATYWGRIIRNASVEQLISNRLFNDMFRSYCEISREFRQKSFSPTVEQIVNFIFYHLQTVTPAQISEHLNYSSVYINRLLKKETGYSTVNYIKQKRIALARTLLRLKDISLEEVAYSVGYIDYNYFCRVFRQVEKISPAQYRKHFLENAEQ